MKLSFKRGQKGFTLVELMVVVGILAVLMSIVVPAVTGTKSTSIGAQVQSDADAVQKAMDNFQNKGISPLYPEEDLGVPDPYKLPAGTILVKKNVVTGLSGVTLATNVDGVSTLTVTAVNGGAAALGTILNYANAPVPAYKEILWNRSTRVWQSDGSVNNAYFVPDFLVKIPSSVGLDNDEGIASVTSGTMLAEFLWLVKLNNPGSQDESRTLEVYRLMNWTSGAATYHQIY